MEGLERCAEAPLMCSVSKAKVFPPKRAQRACNGDKAKHIHSVCLNKVLQRAAGTGESLNEETVSKDQRTRVPAQRRTSARFSVVSGPTCFYSQSTRFDILIEFHV